MNDSRSVSSLNYAGSDHADTFAPADPWLHRFAAIVAVATWLLIIAGGMVTSTGSGLSVPDWPTTYGHNMFTYPYSKWVGGIFYEHGHRLIASSVGFLTIILCIWLQLKERRRWLRSLGIVALVAVIIQGILGGLTVRFLLPTPISVAHACLAQAFFCTVVSIAVFTSPRWISQRPSGAGAGSGLSTRNLGILVIGVVFVQLILGAIMRHTESGLAVLDFPLAYGQLVPDLSPEAVDRYNDYRRFELLIPAITAEQIAVHMIHRAGALLVASVIVGVAIMTFMRHRGVPALCRPMALAVMLVVVQFGLGAWTVLSSRNPLVATAHVAVGAATLAVAVVFTLRAHRAASVRRPDSMPLARLAGVTA
ncbi:MAG: cytochrome oxidase biogenesis protein CtaA [Planctomycetota bacterium]|nr:MAG: cytochrome oxidase biogenesis protein CtaA [Planctomycetota bacterium]